MRGSPEMDTSAPRVSFEPTYGSDKAGLVCAYAFTPGIPGRDITSDEAAMLVATTGDAFLWLHFNLSNTAALPWLQRHLTLPPAFYEGPAEHVSTRLEVVDDALVGVLNDVNFFAAEVSSASSVTLHVSQRMLVSARTKQLRAIDRLRTSVKSGETFRSPAELLAHLLRDQAGVLVDIVRDATQEVDIVEDRVLGQRSTSRSRLGALRRLLVRLQRLLAPEPAALFRLLSRPPNWLKEEDLADLRQSAEELSAAVADSVALVERIRLLQEEVTALLNEQTNHTLFILTVVTVLALPLTVVSGLFGMNVGGIPFANHAGGFWIVVFLVTAIIVIAGVIARARYRDR